MLIMTMGRVQWEESKNEKWGSRGLKKHYTREGGILVCLFLGIFILFATTTSSRITLETKIRVETLKSDLTTVKRLNENEGVKAVFTWTIMVYMAADNDLEDAGVEDLSEMKNSYLSYSFKGGVEIRLVSFDGI